MHNAYTHKLYTCEHTHYQLLLFSIIFYFTQYILSTCSPICMLRAALHDCILFYVRHVGPVNYHICLMQTIIEPIGRPWFLIQTCTWFGFSLGLELHIWIGSLFVRENVKYSTQNLKNSSRSLILSPHNTARDTALLIHAPAASCGPCYFHLPLHTTSIIITHYTYMQF